MKKIKTSIKGLFIIENKSFLDIRGEFMELWNQYEFEKEGLKKDPTQDNISISKKNVIRGLHFQNKPYGQIKYVRVIQGSILDVAVDIRKQSDTFGQHLAIELSKSNNYGLWIPNGFAHGFLSLEENTIVAYKCYGKYEPQHEHTIHWDDKKINIKWNVKNPIISEKDKKGISLETYEKSNRING
ncbi:MAG: dTDP-4-dehydrorhamnose 3,5-epimerase [Flavobacteriales bacterium]|nr:dTDP-4-dehydrorhamnose 3,5-epimerase [Flavobacteriales bacterium]|tara:strand:+ start:339 stop:893 length:555 start_codon:yes stop_codon:yes gene_type:complete